MTSIYNLKASDITRYGLDAILKYYAALYRESYERYLLEREGMSMDDLPFAPVDPEPRPESYSMINNGVNTKIQSVTLHGVRIEEVYIYFDTDTDAEDETEESSNDEVTLP